MAMPAWRTVSSKSCNILKPLRRFLCCDRASHGFQGWRSTGTSRHVSTYGEANAKIRQIQISYSSLVTKSKAGAQ